MNMKNWKIGSVLNLARKIVQPQQKPTQKCYSCGALAPSGFTLCDRCFYAEPKKEVNQK
jgi:hypothetical protein